MGHFGDDAVLAFGGHGGATRPSNSDGLGLVCPVDARGPTLLRVPRRVEEMVSVSAGRSPWDERVGARLRR